MVAIKSKNMMLKRKMLTRRLKHESKLVAEESMAVLNEFEQLENGRLQ